MCSFRPVDVTSLPQVAPIDQPAPKPRRSAPPALQRNEGMRDQLKAHIAAVVEGLRHLDVDAVADLIAEVADDLAGDRDEDLLNGAILDGIRWGYAAAVKVEMAGGAMLRVTLPGGIGITHEWDIEKDAQRQIKAAMEGLRAALVTASNAGDDQ